jgi:hypothetical protein
VIGRVVNRRPEWATLLGSALVLVGLALFIVVFVTLFPILTDPVNAYERWFPSEPDDEVVAAAVEQPIRSGPVARFTWEAVAVESTDPPVYRIRAESTAVPGDDEIVGWSWDLGDGSRDRGTSVVHDYDTYGAYVVTLTVEDAAARADSVSGQVIVPGIDTTAGTIGRVDGFLALDIETSLEDAVGDVGDEINATIDSAFGSIGTTIRGAVVVFLFALAAFATTIVAWRVARIGVMVLTQNPSTRRRDREPPPPGDAAERRERQLELV